MENVYVNVEMADNGVVVRSVFDTEQSLSVIEGTGTGLAIALSYSMAEFFGLLGSKHDDLRFHAGWLVNGDRSQEEVIAILGEDKYKALLDAGYDVVKDEE